MAIDTREKRTSYLGIVTPNSDKDEEWRREFLGVYPFEESGGSGSAATVATPPNMSMGMKMGM